MFAHAPRIIKYNCAHMYTDIASVQRYHGVFFVIELLQSSGPANRRGISALLGDITNDPSVQTHSRRTSREETLSKVAANLEQTHEPRGDASKGGKVKAKLAKNSSKPGNNTLHCIFTKQRELFDMGQECINDFVSKNVSWELQKAIAIQIIMKH